jgi:hypothetical protein
LWHVLTTVARQTPRDMFSMWSDPSLLRNNGKAAFYTGSVPRQQWGGGVFFVVCSWAIKLGRQPAVSSYRDSSSYELVDGELQRRVQKS